VADELVAIKEEIQQIGDLELAAGRRSQGAQRREILSAAGDGFVIIP